ncbi:hypothetical protein BRI6_4080 [plant metagenome]|uniref:GAD-like domain protein n=2 Tax=plant metagenome TaxID=1297885 RepID=A0A484XG90_9ZZZZ
MRSEDFELFIDEFGEATSQRPVPADVIEAYRGELPDSLLTLWQEEGWCGYAAGLLWTVDPRDYEDVLEEWLAGTPFAELDDFHVFARSAFGDLYLCGTKTGASVRLLCPLHSILAQKRNLVAKTPRQVDDSLASFFGATEPEAHDMTAEDGAPLFKRAFKLLGALAHDEIYGFEPALVAGGNLRLENLRRVAAHPHLMILRELSPPAMPFDDPELDRLMG